MKELTIEEKVRRYDEALKRVTIAYKDEDRHLKATLERIFPELKESENEKIPKLLHSLLCAEVTKGQFEKHGLTVDTALDWLEKQDNHEYALKSSNTEDVSKLMEKITRLAEAYELNLPNRSYDIHAFAKDILEWLEKQGEQKPHWKPSSFEISLLEEIKEGKVQGIDFQASLGAIIEHLKNL